MRKIVIRVVCYNQENVISRAIDSVLNQKEWGLYKLIVSDDCSKDKTWEILKDYQANYPDIVEIHRNEHNLGIYGNVAKSNTYLPENYDLFGALAGDDRYCDGYFEAIQKLVEEKKIDTNEAVGIFSDWKSISPAGKEVVHTQEAVLSGLSLWSLYARFKIGGRSLMMSKKVRDGFEPMLEGRGLNLTESQYDAQPHLNINKAYYLPQITTCYYTGIGVAVQLSSKKKSSYYTTQAIEKWLYFLENYARDKKDECYCRFELLKANYYLKPTFRDYFRMFSLYFRGQLPGFRDTLKHTLKLFFQLATYKNQES